MTPINRSLGYVLGNISFNTDGSMNATVHIGYPEEAPTTPTAPTMPTAGLPGIILPDGSIFKTLSQQSYYLTKAEVDSIVVTSTDVTKTIKTVLDAGAIAILVSKGQIPA